MIIFLSCLSAMTPATGAVAILVIVNAIDTLAIAVPDLVDSYTKARIVTQCIQSPSWEMTWADKKFTLSQTCGAMNRKS